MHTLTDEHDIGIPPVVFDWIRLYKGPRFSNDLFFLIMVRLYTYAYIHSRLVSRDPAVYHRNMYLVRIMIDTHLIMMVEGHTNVIDALLSVPCEDTLPVLNTHLYEVFCDRKVMSDCTFVGLLNRTIPKSKGDTRRLWNTVQIRILEGYNDPQIRMVVRMIRASVLGNYHHAVIGVPMNQLIEKRLDILYMDRVAIAGFVGNQSSYRFKVIAGDQIVAAINQSPHMRPFLERRIDLDYYQRTMIALSTTHRSFLYHNVIYPGKGEKLPTYHDIRRGHWNKKDVTIPFNLFIDACDAPKMSRIRVQDVEISQEEYSDYSFTPRILQKLGLDITAEMDCSSVVGSKKIDKWVATLSALVLSRLYSYAKKWMRISQFRIYPVSRELYYLHEKALHRAHHGKVSDRSRHISVCTQCCYLIQTPKGANFKRGSTSTAITPYDTGDHVCSECYSPLLYLDFMGAVIYTSLKRDGDIYMVSRCVQCAHLVVYNKSLPLCDECEPEYYQTPPRACYKEGCEEETGFSTCSMICEEGQVPFYTCDMHYLPIFRDPVPMEYVRCIMSKEKKREVDQYWAAIRSRNERRSSRMHSQQRDLSFR